MQHGFHQVHPRPYTQLPVHKLQYRDLVEYRQIDVVYILPLRRVFPDNIHQLLLVLLE